MARAVLRSGFELESAHVGFVAAGEVINVLESAVNRRGQTRLRCTDGWTSAAAMTGGILFRPAPRPLETVHEEDEGARAAAHIDLLYDRPAAVEPLDEVEAAMRLAHTIEEWLGGIETPRRGGNRFDSEGLIQFGIENKLYQTSPADVYAMYVESKVAGSSPPTRQDAGVGWHGDGEDDQPLL